MRGEMKACRNSSLDPISFSAIDREQSLSLLDIKLRSRIPLLTSPHNAVVLLWNLYVPRDTQTLIISPQTLLG